MKSNVKNIFSGLLVLLVLQSCATKKQILYMQDASMLNQTEVPYTNNSLHPNDILSIKVGALNPEAALPYNNPTTTEAIGNSVELLKLGGYLVSSDFTIDFPVLGELSVKNKTPQTLEDFLEQALESGGHLVSPNVSVRLLNAKVTILGEVNQPGTYTFTENNITVLQALGLAGDLTINGKREDVVLVREENGVRTVGHINLTETDWMNTPLSSVKPNDVLIVNPNTAKVKSAGIIGNAGTALAVASIILSTIVLLTR